MLYGLACIAGLLLSVYWLLNGILKLTGWTDPEERKKATIAAMTAAALKTAFVLITVLVCTMMLAGDTYNPFLYFRF